MYSNNRSDSLDALCGQVVFVWRLEDECTWIDQVLVPLQLISFLAEWLSLFEGQRAWSLCMWPEMRTPCLGGWVIREEAMPRSSPREAKRDINKGHFLWKEV